MVAARQPPSHRARAKKAVAHPHHPETRPALFLTRGEHVENGVVAPCTGAQCLEDLVQARIAVRVAAEPLV
eukprot:11169182-Lingulodinium_polyedra.AAC.1